jgi:hypothetical protein
MIASLQSCGDDPTRFHPQLHSLATEALISPEGSFVPVPCPASVCAGYICSEGDLNLVDAGRDTAPGNNIRMPVHREREDWFMVLLRGSAWSAGCLTSLHGKEGKSI